MPSSKDLVNSKKAEENRVNFSHLAKEDRPVVVGVTYKEGFGPRYEKKDDKPKEQDKSYRSR